MATPLLSLVIYRHGAEPSRALGSHVVGSGLLKLDPALDARVSVLATAKLAEASPTFAAELEAQTHFLEHLEKVTKGITDQLVIPDDLTALDVQPGNLSAKHIAEQVLEEYRVHDGIVRSAELYGMLQSAVHLARQ